MIPAANAETQIQLLSKPSASPYREQIKKLQGQLAPCILEAPRIPCTKGGVSLCVQRIGLRQWAPRGSRQKTRCTPTACSPRKLAARPKDANDPENLTLFRDSSGSRPMGRSVAQRCARSEQMGEARRPKNCSNKALRSVTPAVQVLLNRSPPHQQFRRSLNTSASCRSRS